MIQDPVAQTRPAARVIIGLGEHNRAVRPRDRKQVYIMG
jgi:hypothetical protein